MERGGDIVFLHERCHPSGRDLYHVLLVAPHDRHDVVAVLLGVSEPFFEGVEGDFVCHVVDEDDGMAVAIVVGSAIAVLLDTSCVPDVGLSDERD